MSAPTAPPEEQPLDEAPEPAQPLWKQLATNSSASIMLILAALILVFSVLKFNEFFSVSNARNIATDAAVLLVLATGLTFIIITAGIDLSVGSVLVFSGVICAKVMNALGGESWPVLIAGLVVALLAGCAWGLLNGFLVTKANIPPFIVTLGTLGMALGAALLITGGVDERDVPLKLITSIGSGRLFGQIPYLVLIAAVVAIVFAIILAQTRFGRYTYAIGSNAEGVRRTGVNVDRHLIKVYALGGTLAGLAGYLSLARFGTTSIGGHSTDNLDSIAAIVIGGTSLFGGVGTILGTIVGVFIPAVLRNGFVIVGVQPFWQQVAVGAVLIAAVYFDQLRRSRSNR
ncbi:MAG: ribose transport system permease protein [Solirubrobacteraceae bacterium]|jgi:ribose transport system permease protein|nr:ribose transport system permease protein [Solirubrobacteraceae bacterium]